MKNFVLPLLLIAGLFNSCLFAENKRVASISRARRIQDPNRISSRSRRGIQPLSKLRNRVSNLEDRLTKLEKLLENRSV